MTSVADACGNKLPLAGWLVCSTRPTDSSQQLIASVQAMGGHVQDMPLIAIQPFVSARLVETLEHLTHYDGVVVTSVNAVLSAKQVLASNRIHVSASVPWFTFGAKTGEIAEAQQFTVTVVNEASNAAEFAAALAKRFAERPHRLLFLCGNLARTDLCDALRCSGHMVDSVVCYDTVSCRVDDAVWQRLTAARQVFMPLFSPSAARSLASQWSASDMHAVKIIAVGQTTAAACQSESIAVAATARTPSVQAVVDTMCMIAQSEALK